MGAISAAIGRTLANWHTQGAAEQRALIIPPAIPGSLGDAAMISASTTFLRNAGMPSVDLLYGKTWRLDEKIDRRIRGERFFYRQSRLQQAFLVAQLPRYEACYFIGADVIDGAYNPRSVNARISLVAEAARLGKKATVLGASYNTHPEATTRQALRDLPASVVVCARDPVSRSRMESMLDRPIRQVADLAFLLPPRLQHPIVQQAHDWIERRKTKGDQVIGINANYLHAEKDAGIPPALKMFIQYLLRQSLSLMLIPHDTRSKRPDQTLLEEATASLSAAERERIFMLPPISPGIVRAVTPALDMLATGRMHTAILGLSGGTAPFNFAYQDKFEGLLQFFKLDQAGLLSTPKELAGDPARVAEKFLHVLHEKETYEQHIQQYLPQVMTLARANFL